MLRLSDIHFAYNGRPVLQGLNLELVEGELVALVGPNGSGKSTLLKVISGVVKQGRGVVMWGENDLSKMAPRERAKIVAVVPQNPQLPESLSALEVVFMGRTPYLGLLQNEGPGDRAAVAWAMEVTGTAELASQLVGRLSGGERQRVLMARALAQEAPLLLLDEPTASLDIAYQASVMDTVVSVQRARGGAALVAIHDLTLAAQYCQRIALLKDGSICALGEPRDVVTAENVFAAYGAFATILAHPDTGTPVVLPVPGAARHQDGPRYSNGN